MIEWYIWLLAIIIPIFVAWIFSLPVGLFRLNAVDKSLKNDDPVWSKWRVGGDV